MRQHAEAAFAGALLFLAVIWLIAPWSRLWAQAPSDATVFVDRAIVAYDARQYEQALQELQEALRVDPDHVEALFYQGLIYVALHRRPEAIATWERARQLRPVDIDVAFQLGALYFADERYDMAAAFSICRTSRGCSVPMTSLHWGAMHSCNGASSTPTSAWWRTLGIR
jgi:tetratricopeptide (TPR) repeat protein